MSSIKSLLFARPELDGQSLQAQNNSTWWWRDDKRDRRAELISSVYRHEIYATITLFISFQSFILQSCISSSRIISTSFLIFPECCDFHIFGDLFFGYVVGILHSNFFNIQVFVEAIPKSKIYWDIILTVPVTSGVKFKVSHIEQICAFPLSVDR